jgi:nitroimidazol reductase NimA-like FMN-containing flavoprotein (pyridoxamine 5'-phosphate oxidase superfamily)
MPKVMSREEREAFLADVHVGVISVAAGDDRGPLAVPLWYAYEPGGPVQFMTFPGSRKAQLIEATGRATLSVQQEGMPYRYVTVEGPATLAGGRPDDAWIRALHHRYLGPELGDQVIELMGDTLANEVLFELRPERWTSSDYTEDFGSP